MPMRARIRRSSVSMRTASLRFFVIEAEKMQHAVDDEMGEVVGERLALRRRLACDGGVRKDDIAHEQRLARHRRLAARKCQHVGRGIAAAPAPVEGADHRVVAQHDGNLDRAVASRYGARQCGKCCACGFFRACGGVGQRAPPRRRGRGNGDGGCGGAAHGVSFLRRSAAMRRSRRS